MGLDMYLEGRKYLPTRWDLKGDAREAATRKEDGFSIENITVRLGYWRKHSHLHGYIVREFANDVDECQDIGLDKDMLQKTIEAVEKGELPVTAGFFFGNSHQNGWMDPDGVKESVEMLRAALGWLEQPHNKDYEWRSVVYKASW